MSYDIIFAVTLISTPVLAVMFGLAIENSERKQEREEINKKVEEFGMISFNEELWNEKAKGKTNRLIRINEYIENLVDSDVYISDEEKEVINKKIKKFNTLIEKEELKENYIDDIADAMNNFCIEIYCGEYHKIHNQEMRVIIRDLEEQAKRLNITKEESKNYEYALVNIVEIEKNEEIKGLAKKVMEIKTPYLLGRWVDKRNSLIERIKKEIMKNIEPKEKIDIEKEKIKEKLAYIKNS